MRHSNLLKKCRLEEIVRQGLPVVNEKCNGITQV